jgi:hypothetical protein
MSQGVFSAFSDVFRELFRFLGNHEAYSNNIEILRCPVELHPPSLARSLAKVGHSVTARVSKHRFQNSVNGYPNPNSNYCCMAAQSLHSPLHTAVPHTREHDGLSVGIRWPSYPSSGTCHLRYGVYK